MRVKMEIGIKPTESLEPHQCRPWNHTNATLRGEAEAHEKGAVMKEQMLLTLEYHRRS